MPCHARATLSAAALLVVIGCAASRRPAPPTPFRFPEDTFAFANETVWEYREAPGGHGMTWTRREPPPEFALRCGNMARAARQFRTYARFDPEAPALEPEAYRQLVHDVLHRDPRRQDPAPEPVVIPGYADLRRFSAAHEALAKEALEGPWQTYVQRGNWRMIFPFPPAGQRRVAARLQAEVEQGAAPIVHVLVYPKLTLNHVVLVYAVEETPAEIRFRAYDPNNAAEPVVLAWDRGARTFTYQRAPYFGGGPVRAYEIYDGLLY